jgi:hypothetical protein
MPCCICYEDIVDLIVLPCQHIVCAACLKRLCVDSSSCPVCRQCFKEFVNTTYPNWQIYRQWVTRMRAREVAIAADMQWLFDWFRAVTVHYYSHDRECTITDWILCFARPHMDYIESRAYLRVAFVRLLNETLSGGPRSYLGI